jgi:hypothetical protein
VLLRDPLNPQAPALDHAITLPTTSVIVIIVLLKVDWMCAIPLSMFFFSFFFRDNLFFGTATELLHSP